MDMDFYRDAQLKLVLDSLELPRPLCKEAVSQLLLLWPCYIGIIVEQLTEQDFDSAPSIEMEAASNDGEEESDAVYYLSGIADYYGFETLFDTFEYCIRRRYEEMNPMNVHQSLYLEISKLFTDRSETESLESDQNWSYAKNKLLRSYFLMLGMEQLPSQETIYQLGCIWCCTLPSVLDELISAEFERLTGKNAVEWAKSRPHGDDETAKCFLVGLQPMMPQFRDITDVLERLITVRYARMVDRPVVKKEPARRKRRRQGVNRNS